MSRLVLPLALLAAALSACATSEPPATEPSPPSTTAPAVPAPAEPQSACKPEPAQQFVGQTATADVVEKARVAAGAQLVRTLKPGQVVTMEYHSSRLNLDVSDANVITGARCG